MSNLSIVKNAVAEATKELMREKTIDKISVVEICERSGLERRNFYRYFHDKYEVVDWIYYHDHLLGSKHYEGWGIWDYFPRILEGLAADRKFYYNAFRYRGQNSFRDYCTENLTPILAQDFHGNFPDTISEQFFYDHICNLCFDVFQAWLSKEDGKSPTEMYEFFRTAFRTNAETILRMMDKPIMADADSEEYTIKEPSRK